MGLFDATLKAAQLLTKAHIEKSKVEKAKMDFLKLSPQDEALSLDSNYLKHFAVLELDERGKRIFQVYEQLRKDYPNHSPLFVIEDVGQCEYTNMHARSDYYFDCEGYEEAHGRRDVEKAEFQAVLDMLNAPDSQLEMSALYGRIDLSSPDELKALKQISMPSQLDIGDECDVYLCPTQTSTDCFARMINGYFTDDLQPDEVYTLIRYLKTEFGYEFIGIGATLLLFYNPNANKLKVREFKHLHEELAKVYSTEPKAMEKALEYNIVEKMLALPYTCTLLDWVDLDKYKLF